MFWVRALSLVEIFMFLSIVIANIEYYVSKMCIHFGYFVNLRVKKSTYV